MKRECCVQTMDWKAFFKPTKMTWLIFGVLLLFSVQFFTNTDTKIFPCKTQPAIPDPPAFTDSACGLGHYLGARIVFTTPGYLVMALVLFVVPYLLGCAVNSLVKNSLVKRK